MEKAILVGIHSPDIKSHELESSFAELKFLAVTAGAQVVHQIIQEKKTPDSAYFIGKGKVYQLKEICENEEVDLVIFNNDLRPIQQRNLEAIIGQKIIDRTGLILDIFAARARTKEARLQVELAQFNYLLPRLTGKGVLLSRLGGGIGTRGPGEQKLEIDRRRIYAKISHLKDAINTVKKHRFLQRESRKEIPVPIVAIVGYTNVGKSTILNKLTSSNVYVQDKLFATLDPTTRKLILPNKQEVFLTDTVGFIKNLPHHLVSAFHATLEEVIEADILLNISDITSEEIETEITAVDKVLTELESNNKPTIMVFNKIDKLNSDTKLNIINHWTSEYTNSIAISAITGEGVNLLFEKITDFLSRSMEKIKINIPYSMINLREIIYKQGNVLSEKFTSKQIVIKAEVTKKLASIVKKRIKDNDRHI